MSSSEASTDWTGAVVDDAPRRGSVVHTTRIPADLSEALEGEAVRRGVTPSRLIRDLVEAALKAPDDSKVVQIRVADLHRAIDAVLGQAAA